MKKKRRFLRRNLSRIKNKEKLVIAIKEKLQYPKLTLELLSELESGRRKNIPQELIDDALRALDAAERALNKMAK